MTTKKPPVPTKKLPASAPTAPIATAPPAPIASAPAAAAQRSALDALQAELQEQRLRHLTERTQLERKVTALELTLEELRAELAQATAHARELQAQLQQLRGNR